MKAKILMRNATEIYAEHFEGVTLAEKPMIKVQCPGHDLLIWAEDVERIMVERKIDNEPAGDQIREVIREVASEYGIPTSEITGRKNSHSIADARHVCMTILRLDVGLKDRQVAQRMRRDRSMVSHALQKVASMVATDLRFAERLLRIRKRLGYGDQ